MPLDNATLQTRIETMLATIRTTLTTRQTAYFAQRGRYWQGRWTHRVSAPVDPNPSDTLADTPPDADVGSDRPTDQEEPWGLIVTSDGLNWPGFSLPAKMPMRVYVAPYNGPFGHGYLVTIQVKLAGVVHQRTWNVGPETWRATDWVRVGA